METINNFNQGKPYVFVSYANADYVQVFSDVKRLSESGVNVWIDTELSRYTGKSWRNVARQALRHPNCKAIIFFVSKFSLISSAVRMELDTACSEDVKGTHRGKIVPIIPIGVTLFDDIVKFCYEVSEEYAMSHFESELPDDGGYVPSENANYIREQYIQEGDKLFTSLFDKKDINSFINRLQGLGAVNQPVQNRSKKNQIDSWMFYGKKYRDERKYNEATSCFENAAMEGNADAYIHLGKIYNRDRNREFKEYRYAESCFIRAVDLNKYIAKTEIVALNYNRGDYQIARMLLDEIKNSEEYRLNIDNIQQRYDKLNKLLYGKI